MAAALAPAVAGQAPIAGEVPFHRTPIPGAGRRLVGAAKGVDFAIQCDCVAVVPAGRRTVAEGGRDALPRMNG
jgi:hypothetical protein